MGYRTYTFLVAPRPAVFLDRDGTLTEEVGYVNHPSRLRLQPRSAQAIRRLNGAGIAAVVVTNQAGIARGYFSEDVLAAVNATLVSQLKDEGAYLDGIYVCTHHPTAGESPYRIVCDCRKPRPGLLLRAASELGLEPRDDSPRLVIHAGVRVAPLPCGHGYSHANHGAEREVE